MRGEAREGCITILHTVGIFKCTIIFIELDHIATCFRTLQTNLSQLIKLGNIQSHLIP